MARLSGRDVSDGANEPRQTARLFELGGMEVRNRRHAAEWAAGPQPTSRVGPQGAGGDQTRALPLAEGIRRNPGCAGPLDPPASAGVTEVGQG